MNHVFSVHLLFECRKLLLQHQNARALRVICVLWVVAIWVQLLKQSKLHQSKRGCAPMQKTALPIALSRFA